MGQYGTHSSGQDKTKSKRKRRQDNTLRTGHDGKTRALQNPLFGIQKIKSLENSLSLLFPPDTLHGALVGHSIPTQRNISPSALIAEYRDKLARGDGRPRSNATVVRYLAALLYAFTVAVREWGWLDESPMRKVRKPKESRGQVWFLSDDERQRLLDTCKASRNHTLYLVVILALSTGARKMEILNLTWHDVDLQREIITLHDTKNGERRAPQRGSCFRIGRDNIPGNPATPAHSRQHLIQSSGVSTGIPPRWPEAREEGGIWILASWSSHNGLFA